MKSSILIGASILALSITAPAFAQSNSDIDQVINGDTAVVTHGSTGS